MNRGRDLSTSAHLRVRLARLRVVALADDVARFLAAGMAACVTKPIDEVDLLRRIAETLRRPDIAAAATPPARLPEPPARLDGGQRRAVLDLIATLDDEQDRPA